MTYGPAPESTAQANEFLDTHGRTFQLFIDGEWRNPASNVYFDTYNPSNKQVVAKIAEANEQDVNEAVQAAKNALPEWVAIGGHQRARYLYAIARQIQKHSRLFAVLEAIATHSGKAFLAA